MRLVTRPASRRMRRWWEKVDPVGAFGVSASLALEISPGYAYEKAPAHA